VTGSLKTPLDFSAVIGPVQQCLSLAWAAGLIARITIVSELHDVAANSLQLEVDIDCHDLLLSSRL